MGFFYFVPTSRPTADRELLEQFGLGSVLPSAVVARVVSRGPCGSAGLVLRDASVEIGRFGFYRDEQEWRQVDGSAAWIGWPKGRLPTPEQLARERQSPLGDWVTLDDGRRWFCPTAQRPRSIGSGRIVPSCALSQKLERRDGAWVTGAIRDTDVPLWRVACETFDAIAGGKHELTVQLDSAVLALSANYRVGPTEVGCLGLFESNGRAIWEVLKILVDWPGWEKLLAGESQAAG